MPRKTVVDLTVEALRERILAGEYPEGEPVRQDAVADQLGVSRIPVREALRQLETEGLVTFNPHRGAVVSTLSLTEIEEVFTLRASIESDLLRRAIPRLTDEDLQRADEILDAYELALKVRNVAAWSDLNWQFHSTLHAPADRPLTMGIVQRLHNQSDRYQRMQIALTHGEMRANAEHRAIADAARRRDAKKGCRLLEEHILGAGKSLLDFLEAQRAGRHAGG